MESCVVVVTWIRSRAAKRAEPEGRQCTGCLTAVAGSTDEQLRASGGVLLEGVGWFCGERCERQYRLRFRIQPAGTPAGGSPRTTPTPLPRAGTSTDPAANARPRARRLRSGDRQRTSSARRSVPGARSTRAASRSRSGAQFLPSPRAAARRTSVSLSPSAALSAARASADSRCSSDSAAARRTVRSWSFISAAS